MESQKERYVIIDEGEMEEYLGIKLEHTYNSIRMSQPLLIERIIDAVPNMNKANPDNYPALPSIILTKDEKGEKEKRNGITDPWWEY